MTVRHVPVKRVYDLGKARAAAVERVELLLAKTERDDRDEAELARLTLSWEIA